MNMQEIRQIAQSRGMKTGRTGKEELVRRIQIDEGNFACFGTAHTGECDQIYCMWREDCFAQSTKKNSCAA